MEIEHGKPRNSRRKKTGPDDPAVSLIAESPRQIKWAIFVPVWPVWPLLGITLNGEAKGNGTEAPPGLDPSQYRANLEAALQKILSGLYNPFSEATPA
jgi:hypothetical protein